MKLWLDDEREAPEGWVRVFNVPQLMHMVRNPANEVQEISLDQGFESLSPNNKN
jgi:hypothetical protein